MATKKPAQPKGPQLSLEQYAAIKEKLAKSRLKLHFPLRVKILCLIPLVILIFLILYYVCYLRFLAEH